MIYEMTHQPSVEPWMWLYVAAIGLLGLQMCFVLAANARLRHARAFAVPAAVGMLIWFTKQGWILVISLHVLLARSPAPSSASFIAGSFAVACIVILVKTLFIPKRT